MQVTFSYICQRLIDFFSLETTVIRDFTTGFFHSHPLIKKTRRSCPQIFFKVSVLKISAKLT